MATGVPLPHPLPPLSVSTLYFSDGILESGIITTTYKLLRAGSYVIKSRRGILGVAAHSMVQEDGIRGLQTTQGRHPPPVPKPFLHKLIIIS